MEEKIRMEEAFDETDVRTYSRGDTITGSVVQVEDKDILVDIGYKSEGILPKAELSPFREREEIEPDEEVEVLVTYIDEEKGTVYVSEKQAAYERKIGELEVAFKKDETITGTITEEVKSAGYHVNVDGIQAFLPGSHLGSDMPSVISELKGKDLNFKILELSRKNRNIVVSRREYLNEERKKQIDEIFNELEAGQTIEGEIKSKVDFGLFVDIGGFEGLVHRSEISWKDLPAPPDEFEEGDTVDVKVIDLDREEEKISLSIKRLTPNPWEGVSERYPAGKTIEGEVVSITDFGAFIKLEEDVEGLIHISELSWGYPEDPHEVIEVGETVEAEVLEVDEEEQRISLSARKAQEDPWEKIEESYEPGTEISGKVTKVTDFGAFVQLEEGVEGLVHVSELSWDHVNHPSDMLSEGDEVNTQVLDVDKQDRRISLSIKQAQKDPWHEFQDLYSVGSKVKGEISEIKDFGAFIQITDDVEGLIHVSEISTDKVSTPQDILEVGETVEAKIIGINDEKRQVRLSIRILEEEDSKTTQDSDSEEENGHETISMREHLEEKGF
ncbi:S1 RNA-binding domain-containing protein [Candidatus Bipolaricaulota bacterium]|nr:S1 RNA-binding domain-containing protein [Candidatus Bipolaricaulota bacterium]MBS3813985.1 S1 RNA-binding domain-containing protein [Candidatus Bipolaricaulota bacterium]MBS3825116.1 S1 RNA-binding domain-containing protein [Candidatus Bipolaricaulota bacterium]